MLSPVLRWMLERMPSRRLRPWHPPAVAPDRCCQGTAGVPRGRSLNPSLVSPSGAVVVLGGDEQGQGGSVRDPELGEHAREASFDRLLAGVHGGGNLAVRVPPMYERGQLALPLG